MAPTPAGRAHARRFAGFTPLALLAVVASACGALSITPEPATPTDFPGLAGRFNASHVTVRDWVSGDAGCTNRDLIPSAISFTASGVDQVDPVRVYLYIFRDRAAFDRHRDEVGPCAAAFVTDPDTYEEVEASPYIVAGQGPWAPGFEAAVRKVLEQAAGTGG